MKLQKNVLEYLEESAKNYPNKIAYTDERNHITFGELLEKSCRIGTQIAKSIRKTNRPIAVFVDRNVESIMAFMAILQSGNFYVPIDNKMPKQRLEKMLEKLNPELIIYNEKDEDEVQKLQLGYKMQKLEETEKDETILRECRNKVLDIDPVYVIFTSGSTGTPKGIVISHRSVIDFIEWMAEACEINEGNIMGNQAPFYFDLSVKDIYLTLKCGATMHILSKKLLMFPTILIDYLNEKKVNTLIWATSAFNLISNSKILEKKQIVNLRKVILGGEALLAKHLNTWRNSMPEVQYINLYGPTEVTVDCTYYKIDKEFKDHEAIPIGKACENKQIIILDENLNEVEDGVAGEICVRGIGLAKGYYNDEEKTNEVFIQNPQNLYYRDIIYKTGDIGYKDKEGNIIFSSRKDGQIKHMGYRIELGEIERAVNSFEKIKSAICFYDEKNNKIVCVYEGNAENTEIINYIKEIIPKYMYPNIVIQKSRMPYNANGKIDRAKLKKEYEDESGKDI